MSKTRISLLALIVLIAGGAATLTLFNPSYEAMHLAHQKNAC